MGNIIFAEISPFKLLENCGKKISFVKNFSGGFFNDLNNITFKFLKLISLFKTGEIISLIFKEN